MRGAAQWRKAGLGALLFAGNLAIVLFMAFPILWVILTSLKNSVDVFAYPPKLLFTPTLDNYAKLLTEGLTGETEGSILRPFLNSTAATLISTTLAMTVACLGGYSLARLRPRWSGALLLFILGVRMLPPIVLVVPTFQIMNSLGLMDTLIAIIVPYTALSIPLAIWMMHSFFIDLPKELEEAAIVDGSTRFGAFWRVILPLAAPGLAATAIFSFILAWNDLEFALPLTTFKATTLPVIASRVRAEEGILWGQLGAVASLMTIPVVIFTFAVQKHIVKALTAGVGK